MFPTSNAFTKAFCCASAFLYLSATALAQPAPATAPSPAVSALYPTLSSWKAACAKLPTNRSLSGALPRRELLPLPEFHLMDDALDAFFVQSKTGLLANRTNWVGAPPAASEFFNTATAYFLRSETAPSQPAIPFQPYTQKLEVPAGAEIFFRADLHGDIHSLVADLSWLRDHGYLRDDFTVARPQFYMVFLGDYTDRGVYGIEVIYTLLRLKLANPERVFLARGNHEDVSLQARYGFLDEGRAKYGRTFDAKKILRLYDFLPVVIYVGTQDSFIQCNHGGMEPGFDPRSLLDAPGPIRFQFLGALHQRRFLTEHPSWLASADSESRDAAGRALRDFKPDDPISPTTLGFMWNDFSLLASDPQFAVDPGRAFVYGKRATQYLLRIGSSKSKLLQAVFRGHQQASALNPMMSRLLASDGVFRHWQAADNSALLNASVNALKQVLESTDLRPIPPGSVWTFNVSPDSIYGERCGYATDAFGLLRTASDFSAWRLQIVNIPIAP